MSPFSVPVFPLPDVVFFPRTLLPLHVFEPRYRTLVRDAGAGERLIAVSLLLPGYEQDYHRSPAFHPVGTVGRIADLVPLPDGRFLVRLSGLQRVKLGEVIEEQPYRLVRFEPLPEQAVDESSPEVFHAKLDVLASHGCLLRELRGGGSSNIVLDERTSFEAAVNGACASLPAEAALKQSLLEEDDLFRRQQRVSQLLDAVLAKVLKLKAGSKKTPRGELN